jgi:hypothetical protein
VTHAPTRSALLTALGPGLPAVVARQERARLNRVGQLPTACPLVIPVEEPQIVHVSVAQQ